jgi:hypothetical protein
MIAVSIDSLQVDEFINHEDEIFWELGKACDAEVWNVRGHRRLEAPTLRQAPPHVIRGLRSYNHSLTL